MALGSRALDLLFALLSARDRVVPKSELLDQVWAGLVVEENNLQVQMSALRKVLGNEAIRTVPGIGYRFTLAVQQEAVGAPGQAASLAARLLPAGPLIGRQQDLDALLARLTDQTLVTLSGPGGIGKTALATHVAHRWVGDARGPVHWVELADVAQAAGVAAAVAQALGIESLDEPSLALWRQPSTRARPLLVLDNAETQAQAVAEVCARLMGHLPDLRLLVTSQTRLKVNGEWLHRLAPLDLPAEGESGDGLRERAAVALFIEQAQASGARLSWQGVTLDQVARICRRLDGLPLAIKLVASRAGWMGVDALAAMMDGEQAGWGGEAPDLPSRQRTVDAAMQWSVGLLTPSEQTAFRWLGALRGHFALDLALRHLEGAGWSTWAALDRVGALVDRSLLEVVSQDPPRYRMLDSARRHAWQSMASPQECDAIQAHMARAVADWMAQAFDAYASQADAAWLQTHAGDLDTVRVALAWAREHDLAVAVRLMGASCSLFMLTGRASEARAMAEDLMPALPQVAQTAPADAARLCVELSRIYWGVSHQRMHELARQGLAWARQAGHAVLQHQAWRGLAVSGVHDGDLAVLQREMRLLAQPGWPPRWRAQGLYADVCVAQAQGRLDDALQGARQLQAQAAEAGFHVLAAVAQCTQASILLRQGQVEAAGAVANSLLETSPTNGGTFLIHANGVLAQAHVMANRLAAAQQALLALIDAALGRDGEWLSLYADLMAVVAARQERLEDAARLLGCAARADCAMRVTLTGRQDHVDEVWSRILRTWPEAQARVLMAQGAAMDGEAVRACVLA